MLLFGLREIKKCLFSYKAKTYLLAPLINEQFSDKAFSAVSPLQNLTFEDPSAFDLSDITCVCILISNNFSDSSGLHFCQKLIIFS